MGGIGCVDAEGMGNRPIGCNIYAYGVLVEGYGGDSLIVD